MCHVVLGSHVMLFGVGCLLEKGGKMRSATKKDVPCLELYKSKRFFVITTDIVFQKMEFILLPPFPKIPKFHRESTLLCRLREFDRVVPCLLFFHLEFPMVGWSWGFCAAVPSGGNHPR